MTGDETTAQQQEADAVTIKITLRDYLTKLELLELEKPPGKRRPVPTISDLARAAGTSRVAMSNLANNNVKLANLEALSAALSELRRRGFKATLNDILAAYPAEAEESEAGQ